eukprot:CAMPEP_0174840904 /NCGR_PEP_ID=MMETSP1114-20130205/8969_1 /TAXON_ID=312471 /ORGANISM="Neobodo designis, Strain CCAP 1951/1" /LENGTH=1087 /DNA_ID=CAMNT_0016075073 /DNA_START=63 /DNA_END=3326 /DNA_ORIENTATION=+
MRLAAAAACALLLAAAVAASPASDLSAFGYDPKANPSAVVTSGNARFTVLSNYLVRMEYSSSASFEDGPTLAVVNRNTPVVQFTQSTSNGVLTITTPAVTVNYHTGQEFNANSLTATTTAGGNWYFGQYDDKNLFGTIKSLDLLCNPTLNCSQNSDMRIHKESLHCTWGVVSQNGWAVYDDSNNYLMNGDWFDNSARSSSTTDIYFFGHGKNFKAAAQDLNRIAGKQPLTHKSLYGSWYTRWFDFTNDDIQGIVDNYKKAGLPLDTLILDMNWHTKDSWTGYSWDKELYPVPSDTVAFAHNQGLRIGANLHDAVGFGPWEDQYSTMANAVGIDPSSKQTVPFMPLNKTYMHTMEDSVLKALGFDVWWIDWQQGGNVGGTEGQQMNPTFITDHVRSTDSIRRGENKRDQILARWGGMGTQRYPVGFSGDVSQLSWQCMAYQPYFSATAANVGYGHISNDLVGPAGDHELHVRWMQFGSYSPILRIHDRGMSSGGCWGSDSCAIVNMWFLPFKYLDAIRSAMLERSALQPYIYNAQRLAYDTGLTMVRPMYYDFSAEPEAYTVLTPNGGGQYMFGDDMFVDVITKASTESSGLVQWGTWIPPGTWYDDVFGEVVTGPQTLNRQYMLNDVPRFIRAGAVIPRVANPTEIGVAGGAYTEVDWSVYPGATSGAGRMYEDDGASLDYISGKYAVTYAAWSLSGTTYTITIKAANGSFTGLPANRQLRVILVGVPPLSSATVGGVPVNYVRFPAAGQASYTYDGRTGSAIVALGSQSTASDVTVTADLVQADTNPSMTRRMKVFAKRAAEGKRVTDDYQATPFETVAGPGNVKQAGARAGYISAVAGTSPSTAVGLMGLNYWNLITEAIAEYGGSPGPTPLPTVQMQYLLQFFDHQRGDMLLCATEECVATNGNYQLMWIDGWQAQSGDAGKTALYDYYDSDYADNWATTQSTSPQSGYTAAFFSDGAVFDTSNGGAGKNCIDVYYLAATQDHLTTSCPEGAQWATDNGYTKVSSCIGYTYASQPGATSAERPSLASAQAHVDEIRKKFRLAKQGGAIAKPPKKAKKIIKKGKVMGSNDDPTAIATQIFQSMTG